jgi:diguanylate cyclase (GGDEF)-like protein
MYLKEKISASSSRTFAGIMLDVNDFKTFNDQYGHAVGDEILKTAAKLLQECLNENDFIARYGGDEFFIVLDVDTEAELVNRVYDINRRIIAYNATNDKLWKIEFSMGYMVYERTSNMSVEEFERVLDQLMYQDKQEYKERKKKSV